MEKYYKPGERFNAFQEKRKKYEEKKHKGMPTLKPVMGGAAPKGLNAGVNPMNMGLTSPKVMKAPKMRTPKMKHMKMCKEHKVEHTKAHHEKFHKHKKHLKSHSEESIKALREFADDESKEKSHRKHMKHRKEHSSEEISGLRKFVDEEAKEKGKKGKKKSLRSPASVVKSEQNASHQYKKHEKSFNTTTKKTGKFEGKSNALGHGGRAAQLRARGVPGGVIGAMARAAHAAPGQANYHGHRKHEKKCKVCGK